MTGDRFIRSTLWVAAVFNVCGAGLFAFPASGLGQLAGLPPEVPAVYRFVLALLVFSLGCAYFWLARQETISRPFILFAALSKFGAFAVVFVLWLVQQAALASVIVISADLVISALWFRWLANSGSVR